MRNGRREDNCGTTVALTRQQSGSTALLRNGQICGPKTLPLFKATHRGSAVPVQCHPPCSHTKNVLKAKPCDKWGDFGAHHSAVHGSYKGILAGPCCTAVKAAQHSRRVWKYKMSVLPQPDRSTVLSGQTINEESRKKVNGQHSLFGSSCRLSKSPSQLTDKQRKTQGFSFCNEVLFTMIFPGGCVGTEEMKNQTL